MDRLSEVIQVLARPLEFAVRSGPAGITAIKGLGGFVSTQVFQALGQTVRSAAIEAELLRLAQLFSDYDNLTPAARIQCVVAGRALLARMGEMVEPSSSPAEALSPVVCRLWECPVQFVRGVGPRKAEALARAGIRTVEDAVWSLPWRYEDRTHTRFIADLVPGQEVLVAAEVETIALKTTRHQRKKIVEVRVADRTGGLDLIWFNQGYLAETFRAGQRVMLYGLVKAKQGRWTQLQMENPTFEILSGHEGYAVRTDLTHMGRIVPIYHGRETKLRLMMSDRIRAIMKEIVDQYAEGAVDPLPADMLQRRQLVSFGEAVREAHFPTFGAKVGVGGASEGPPPTLMEDLNRGRTPAHRRLAFEDFLLLELALGRKREEVKKESRVLKYDLTTLLPQRLLKTLPFSLTDAQARVLREINRDLSSPHPMNRLVQGDVGCGKTVVAVLTMLIAVGSDYQAALMAPTEILAEQHYLTLHHLLEPLGVSCVLLSGGRGGKKRKAALEAIADGKADIVIGTHALIQQGVCFKKLGVAVIDEQHKFGVLQRATLKDKGYTPDILVMTATPIPRTLALTVYGDLDVSVIETLPPGRIPVRTLLFAEGQRGRPYRLIEDELARGRQAYVVYPLVEESEKVDLQAAISGAARLQREVFPKWQVGLIHGRMKTEEKDRVMAAFKKGDTQVLVGTTVIEVGIDVANASVMMVEHADRFGLAQLHQLRGRVGRGRHQSYCFLVGPSRLTEEGRRRLEALVKSHDGFVIAEEDLNIRGPGEFFGTRQWGPADLRVANLIRDARILDEAREEAAMVLQADPQLSLPVHVELQAALLRRWKEKLDLVTVS